MKTIIHDFNINPFQENESLTILDGTNPIHHCVGCFGCWIKTPSKCVIKDNYQQLANTYWNSEEVIIISECIYGCYSPFIKAVLDRSIGYILPYFRMVNKEMHHKLRYPSPFQFTVYFYGNISKEEKITAKQLVKANTVNFGVTEYHVNFFKNKEQIKEQLHEYCNN